MPATRFTAPFSKKTVAKAEVKVLNAIQHPYLIIQPAIKEFDKVESEIKEEVKETFHQARVRLMKKIEMAQAGRQLSDIPYPVKGKLKDAYWLAKDELTKLENDNKK